MSEPKRRTRRPADHGDHDELCPWCLVHCPYCGLREMELVGERGEQMECQACGHYETTFHPEFVRLRDLQVRVLTGSSIRDWKAKAQQLSPRFHHRWGSTLQYLDPATSAAISRMDDLARVYAAQIPYDDELFLIRGKAARRLFQSHLEANPTLSPVGDDERAYVDDWF